jgi:hypothetical protein
VSSSDERFRIPDSDLLFPEVKMARGLAGRGGWRRAFAWAWLVAILVGIGAGIVALAIHAG